MNATPPCDDRLGGSPSALDAGHRVAHRVGLVGVGDHLDGVGRVEEPVLGQHLLTVDRLELCGVAVLGGEARGVELDHAEAGDGQQDGRHDPDGARARP